MRRRGRIGWPSGTTAGWSAATLLDKNPAPRSAGRSSRTAPPSHDHDRRPAPETHRKPPRHGREAASSSHQSLIGMDAVPGRQLRHRRLLAHRLQGDPRLECRIELPSRSAHHPLRLPRRNGCQPPTCSRLALRIAGPTSRLPPAPPDKAKLMLRRDPAVTAALLARSSRGRSPIVRRIGAGRRWLASALMATASSIERPAGSGCPCHHGCTTDVAHVGRKWPYAAKHAAEWLTDRHPPSTIRVLDISALHSWTKCSLRRILLHDCQRYDSL